MADAPDDKRRTDAAKKPWDASAPLDFEKTSVEDAKRTISETQASFHATSAAQQAANNVLLDTTAAWFGQLPAALRPLQIGRHHRRVANTLCALWNQHAACQTYFEELLDRSHAKHPALPADALSELATLRKYHVELMSQPGPGEKQGNRPRGPALHEATLAWIAQLPEHLRPMELMRAFPRIANRLCETWKRPSVCEHYFDELLVDRRGGRKGFPLKIASELTELRAYYARLYPADHGAWSDGQFMA